METAVLVVHLMIAAALVTVVLFQQSEGGALGMGGGGGGGGGGGFLSGRGAANLLTRVTAVLALAFFCTSIALTILGNRSVAPSSVMDNVGAPASSGPAVPGSPATKTSGQKGADTPAVPTGGVLDALKRGERRLPRIPQGQ